MSRRRRGSPLLSLLLLAALVVGWIWLQQLSTGGSTTTSARPGASAATALGTDPASGLLWVQLADLPPEAADTLRAIRKGAPFPTRKDGTTFFNNERVLPRQKSGYYREFTVPTPGESDRGARRVVTGGPNFGTANGEFYYTDDHYASFRRIKP